MNSPRFITALPQTFSSTAAAAQRADSPSATQKPEDQPAATLTAPGKLSRWNPAWLAVLARSLSQLRGSGKKRAAGHWMEAAAFWWKQLSGPPLRQARRPRQKS